MRTILRNLLKSDRWFLYFLFPIPLLVCNEFHGSVLNSLQNPQLDRLLSIMLTIFFVYFLSTILLKKRKLYISNIFSQKCNSNIFPLGRHPLVGMLEHFTDKFPDNFFESLISLLPGGEKESILFQCSKLFCDSIKCKLGVHSPETQSNKLHLSNKLPKNRGKKTVTNSHRSVRYMYVQ